MPKPSRFFAGGSGEARTPARSPRLNAEGDRALPSESFRRSPFFRLGGGRLNHSLNHWGWAHSLGRQAKERKEREQSPKR